MEEKEDGGNLRFALKNLQQVTLRFYPFTTPSTICKKLWNNRAGDHQKQAL